MAKGPKKAAAKPKPAKKPGRKKKDSAAVAAAGATPRPNTVDVDEENRKLFLNVHLPSVKTLISKKDTAVSNLRKAYKSAKAEGGFTKADFDIAIQIEDEEKEARAKARIARQLVIARYMGKQLGDQLELFMEPDRTPASDIAFKEGEQAATENKAAKPGYDPATEQHRRYMEGYHSVSERRVRAGIKKKGEHPEVKADEDAKAADKAKASAQKEADAKAFQEGSPPPALADQTSGVPTSRAAFLKQQQELAERQTAGDSAFSKRN